MLEQSKAANRGYVGAQFSVGVNMSYPLIVAQAVLKDSGEGEASPAIAFLKADGSEGYLAERRRCAKSHRREHRRFDTLAGRAGNRESRLPLMASAHSPWFRENEWSRWVNPEKRTNRAKLNRPRDSTYSAKRQSRPGHPRPFPFSRSCTRQ